MRIVLDQFNWQVQTGQGQLADGRLTEICKLVFIDPSGLVVEAIFSDPVAIRQCAAAMKGEKTVEVATHVPNVRP